MKKYLDTFAPGIKVIVLAPIPPEYVCRGDDVDILYAARIIDGYVEIKVFLVNQKLHDQIQNLFALMRSTSETPVDKFEELFDQVILVVETEDVLGSGLFRHDCRLICDLKPPPFTEDELLQATNRVTYLSHVLTRSKR